MALGEVGNLLVRLGAGGVTELDGTEGSVLGAFPIGSPNHFEFGGDDLVATDPSDELLAFDPQTGALIGSILGPTDLRNAGTVRFAPGGEYLLLNQIAGVLTLDRLDAAGTLTARITGIAVNDFVVSSSGRIVAATAADELVEIDIDSGAVSLLSAAVLNPGRVILHPSGDLLVKDGNGVHRFGPTGTAFGTFTTLPINHMTVGPNGDIYASTPADSIVRLDGATGTVVEEWTGIGMNPGLLAFRPIPEPSTALLLGVGLAGMAVRRKNPASGSALQDRI